MEEEGSEDNGLEEDSRDGQVCWAWGAHLLMPQGLGD